MKIITSIMLLVNIMNAQVFINNNKKIPLSTDSTGSLVISVEGYDTYGGIIGAKVTLES